MYILDAASALARFPQMEQALALRINPSLFHGGLPRLILKYEEPGLPEQVSIGVAGRTVGGGSGGTWIDARVSWNIPSVYLGSSGAATLQDRAFFGEIEKAKRQREVLPALKILEPRLDRLSLAPLAGESVIHGDIGMPRLVPMPFMGEGVRRALSIVLAIANAPLGVVLIDEIENGLHYSVMKDVWKAIGVAARQLDVQVFATTHSYECITAAHEAFTASGPYDLRLYRLDRINEGIQVAAYDQDVLGYAAEMSHEVR